MIRVATDFMPRLHFAARRAITLVELTLVLAIAAIVAAVAIRAYSSAQLNNRIDMQTQQIATVRAAILTLYPNQDYGGLWMSKLASALPDSMLTADKQNGLNPFGGIFYADHNSVDGGQDNVYVISLANIPKSACQRLAQIDMTPAVVQFYIGDKNDHYHRTAAGRATPQEAASYCQDNGQLSWWFYE